MNLAYLRGSRAPDGSLIPAVRHVEDGESVWRRVPPQYFSQERDLPTPAAFRDEQWDEKRKAIRQRRLGGRKKLSPEEEAQVQREVAAAKAAREISVNLVREMRDPRAALLVDGPDRTATDHVVEVEVAVIRREAFLDARHTPNVNNVAHADILGDYEKVVSIPDVGDIETRGLLAMRSHVAYHPPSCQ